MKVTLATAAAVFAVIQAAASVNAHSVLLFPYPRDGSKTSEYGDKIRGAGKDGVSTPAERTNCGDLAANPGKIKASFKPGSKVTVLWKTTIPHESAPGVRIALATAPGAPFTLLTPVSAAGNGPDIALEKYEVTLPNTPCANCVLQYIWDSYADGGYYKECADISISATATNTVYTPPAPSPAPGDDGAGSGGDQALASPSPSPAGRGRASPSPKPKTGAATSGAETVNRAASTAGALIMATVAAAACAMTF